MNRRNLVLLGALALAGFFVFLGCGALVVSDKLPNDPEDLMTMAIGKIDDISKAIDLGRPEAEVDELVADLDQVKQKLQSLDPAIRSNVTSETRETFMEASEEMSQKMTEQVNNLADSTMSPEMRARYAPAKAYPRHKALRLH